MKRAAQHARHLLQDDPEGQGGADTTDESDSEVRQYERQRLEVTKTAQSVFADADEEYSSVQMVKQRMQDWQRRQPEAFRSAYAAESAPAVFAPFVRNELLEWVPIFGDSRGSCLQKQQKTRITRFSFWLVAKKECRAQTVERNSISPMLWTQLCS